MAFNSVHFFKKPLILIAICLPFNSFSAPTIPGAIEPGRIEKRFEKPVEPKSQLLIEVPEKVEQIPPKQAKKIKFELSVIELSGNTVYSKPELSDTWSQQLNKTISLKELYAIADRITAFYRNEGYILTQAIIPPQKINNGSVLIKVIEGHVSDVLIEGDMQGRADLFDEWAEKIKASKPLNNSVLERYTLIGSDLSGTKVKSIIRPSKTIPGTSEVVLNIEHNKMTGSFTLDNRGTETSGPYQSSLNVNTNSLFNQFGGLNVSYLVAEQGNELKYLSAQYNHPINSEGLKLNITTNMSESSPGGTIEQLEIESDNLTFTAGLSYPIIRSRNKNLSVESNFIYRDSKSKTLGLLQSEDRTRAINLGLTYDYADKWQGVNSLSIKLTKGLNVLDATETGSANLSRAEGQSDFTKLNISLSRQQELSNGFSLLFATSIQKTNDALLSSEEFGYGGDQYGRAYDSSTITGDEGFSAKAELKYTNKLPLSAYNYYQLYTFYDVGSISSNKTTSNTTTAGSSYGAGIRFGITKKVTGNIEVAQPLSKELSTLNSQSDTPRWFSNLNIQF